jgi:hypothetical protein
MDNAIQAGISTKFNWQKHPQRMLQMRARSYCLRDAYPDLLKGLGMVEEVQDHENTPPEIQSFDLPKQEPQRDPAVKATFESVERAMHQSDTMEQLLAAAKDAKSLSEEDQVKLRATYKQMREALLDTGAPA